MAPLAAPYWYWPPGIFDLATGKSARIPLDYAADFHHMAWTPDGKIMAVALGWHATIWKFTPDGTRTVFVGPEAFAPETSPIGLAFDTAGNLFVSTEGSPGSDSILVFTPDGMESTFATGLTQPRGLAFDASGNLFVAETRPAPLGDIVEFPTGGGEIVFASGIDRPEFLTFGPPR